ncbi:hypothetical protein E4U21_000339 [Claviceps maximensis]|nr:hypothetical protein E4U21_000339 [Claviceps maximensis]
MSTADNPVESWLDHIQGSIVREDDDVAEAAGLDKDKLPPLQAQHDEDGETGLKRAHKRGPDPSALTSQQSSQSRTHDPVGELRHRQQTLIPLGYQPRQDERTVAGLNVATLVPSNCGRPAVQCLEEDEEEKFVRRRRRKTRADRYETKNALASDKAHDYHQNNDDGDDRPRASRKARLKIRLRSGKEVMSNFSSESICRDTLIMKPGVTTGNQPDVNAQTRERRAVADLMCYDFDLGHDVRRLSSQGRINQYIQPVSCQVLPRLKEPATYPSSVAGCKSPLRYAGALSHLENPTQEMTSQNDAQWPKALNGASRPHDDTSTTLNLETRISRPPRSRRRTRSKRYLAEEPLQQPVRQYGHNTARFESKAQHQHGELPESDTFLACRQNSATFHSRNTASMHSSRACIDLGGGQRLDFGRLRNRGLYRADRVAVPGDEMTINVNKLASQLQHTREIPFARVERQVISARRRTRYFDDEGYADDLLRRRFSQWPTSMT